MSAPWATLETTVQYPASMAGHQRSRAASPRACAQAEQAGRPERRHQSHTSAGRTRASRSSSPSATVMRASAPALLAVVQMTRADAVALWIEEKYAAAMGTTSTSTSRARAIAPPSEPPPTSAVCSIRIPSSRTSVGASCIQILASCTLCNSTPPDRSMCESSGASRSRSHKIAAARRLHKRSTMCVGTHWKACARSRRASTNVRASPGARSTMT